MKNFQKCCSKMYWKLRACKLGLLTMGFTVAWSRWVFSWGRSMSISLSLSFWADQILQNSLPVFCMEHIGLAFSILGAELRKKTDSLSIQYVNTLNSVFGTVYLLQMYLISPCPETHPQFYTSDYKSLPVELGRTLLNCAGMLCIYVEEGSGNSTV